MRKDVALIRKKIDAVNKELKPLGYTCQKKVILSLPIHIPLFLWNYRFLQLILVWIQNGVAESSWCPDLSQEREYKEALEAFNEKNKEKVQLVNKLMEVSPALKSLSIDTVKYVKSRALFDICPSEKMFVFLWVLSFCSAGGWKWEDEDEEAGGAG